MSYEKDLDDLNKLAPEFLKHIGFSDNEINKVFTIVESETNQRQQLFEELVDAGFKLILIEEDFPVKWYEVNYNNRQVTMNHDMSPYLCLMDSNHNYRETFNPSAPNVIDAIKDYIDKFGTDISINKNI